MRLRLNLPIVDLSYRFGVGRSTISKVFLEVIQVMVRNPSILTALARTRRVVCNHANACSLGSTLGAELQ